MRLTFRFHFALIFTGLLIVPALELLAQQSSKTGTRTAQSAPAGKPATQKAPPKEAVEEVDPEKQKLQQEKEAQIRLDQILARWETESSKIKSLHGKQSKSEFNPVFASETVTRGVFFLEMPDKGRIDFEPIKIKPGDVSKRKTKEGEPYSLASGKAERWICNGETILSLNDEAQTYDKQTIPEDLRGKNIVESPLPFLFGMKADEAKRRFKLSIYTKVPETKEAVTLMAIPKMAKDLENYERALITLDKKTYLPMQVRTVDQSHLEICYTFGNVVINDRDIKSQFVNLFNLDKDPFKPNLKGYTAVVHPEDIATKDIQPAAGKKGDTSPPVTNPPVKQGQKVAIPKDKQLR